MPYIPLPTQVGVFPDDTPLAAKGAFTDANQIRFVRGKPQTRGGWSTASNDTVEGKCRGMHAWNARGTNYTALGTHTHLQVYSDGEIFDITPIVSLGSVSNPFSTTNGSPTVTFALTSHGMVDGQRVVFPGQTSVNGATISDADGYEVTVTTANAVTFTADSNATSSGSGVGGTVDYDILLAPGLENGLGGPGYGVGGFGLGGYGEGATETDFSPRTWSLDNWIPNLLALPRGGAIYEWAPNLSSSDLVTNGDFSSATGWTAGTGWTISAGQALATSGSASLLSTQIEVIPNSYLMIEMDMTRAAGTLDVRVDGVDMIADLAATARVRRICYTAAGGTVTLAFAKDASFSGSLDNVSVSQMVRAAALPGAPSQNDTMLVTPELIVMVFGTIDADSGEYNPLQVRNSDTGDGNLAGNQTWVPAPDNLAYRWTLGSGSRCVAGRKGNAEIIIGTDTAAFRARYTGNPNAPYAFQPIGPNHGIIGVNAITVQNGIAYWMTPAKEFAMYDGGAARNLDSSMVRYVGDNLSPAQYDKIFAFPISKYGEVCWHYPDIRDGNEISRYALFSPSQGAWAPGLFDRTAWIDTFGTNPPMAVSADGVLYFQETGFTADGDPLEWMLRTGAMDIAINGDGGELYQINFFIPDEDDLQGGYNYTMIAYELPNSDPVEYGPFGVTVETDRLDFDPVIARQAEHLFEGNSAPAFCRFGSPRLDVSKTGMIF